MKSFYVAGKFEDKERVRNMIAALRGLGWHCTFDWTKGPSEVGTDELRDIALWEVKAASECDVLVLLSHPNGKGSYFEAGCAVAMGKPVWMVPYKEGQRATALLYHPLVTFFDDDQALVAEAIHQFGYGAK